MNMHRKFILTPVISVLEEMKQVTSCIGAGIEYYPLWDYILQSTFIKMTGFQEQKAKCIDWELATNSYEYRRTFLKRVKERGEYSTYSAKNEVYKELVKESATLCGKGMADFLSELNKAETFDPKKEVDNTLINSSILYCRRRDYEEFLTCDRIFAEQYWIIPKNNVDKGVKLFESALQKYYEDGLYMQRNRVAHNTQSYQRNLPELESLKNEQKYLRNYFCWFAILVLIDDIFMSLYKKYLRALKTVSYFEY